MNESATSILYSPDLVVAIVNQKVIVSGEMTDAKLVKKKDNGTFPSLIWVSKPEMCPPGTIITITAATANKE